MAALNTTSTYLFAVLTNVSITDPIPMTRTNSKCIDELLNYVLSFHTWLIQVYLYFQVCGQVLFFFSKREGKN